jgi:hypothetical protein
LQFISQEQQVPSVQQNGRSEGAGANASPSEEASLPDLADLSDLESILSLREDEDLVLDIDEAMIDIDDLHDGVLPDVNDDLSSD